MKKLLLLITTILLLISCSKQQQEYSIININTIKGLEIEAPDAIDIIFNNNSIMIYHNQQIWSYWTNTSDSDIILEYNNKKHILKSTEKLSLPLTSY